MNPLSTAILAYLLTLHSHWSDRNESIEDRRARMSVVAVSIEDAANLVTCYEIDHCKPIYHDRFEMAASLIRLAYIESTLAKHIHEGNCRKLECDKGLAIGLWQGHNTKHWSIEYWKELHSSSLEATVITARMAAGSIAGGVGICGSLAGSFSQYNTGYTCSNAFKYEIVEQGIYRTANWLRIKVNGSKE